MTSHRLTALATIAIASSCLAQSPNLVLSLSQLQNTLSGSGGTVLQFLYPNEMAYLKFGPCASLSSEKWLPRTCSHVMAGDENADGEYWNPAIFGDVDAVLTHQHSGSLTDPDNQRTVFWSVSSPMGSAISSHRFHPGDVARIVSDGSSDGRVETFMSRAQFNTALGRNPYGQLDIDAIAWNLNFGIWFSIDNGVINANTMCGAMAVRDGDVVCIPPSAITYTIDGRIASVAGSSAVVVYPEAQMDAFTANANVADNVGNLITMAGDVEGLEIDFSVPITTVITCAGMPLDVPALLFTTETGRGASILTTQGAGQIYTTPCGLAGTPYGTGVTTGAQVGILPTFPAGIDSHITGLGFAHARTYTLETDTPVIPLSSTASHIDISYNTPFLVNVMFLQLVPPSVPHALVGLPFSQTCFPDFYAPATLSIGIYIGPGFGVLPTPPLPSFYSGKILFQSVAPEGNSIEFSTPMVVDWR
jgi:hypothetical protein